MGGLGGFNGNYGMRGVGTKIVYAKRYIAFGVIAAQLKGYGN